MEPGLFVSQAKPKKLRRSAKCQRWQNCLVVLISGTIPEPGESAAARGDVITGKSAMAITIMSSLLTTPLALGGSSPALHGPLLCSSFPDKLGYLHPCLPEVNHPFLGYQYSPKQLEGRGPEMKDLYFFT